MPRVGPAVKSPQGTSRRAGCEEMLGLLWVQRSRVRGQVREDVERGERRMREHEGRGVRTREMGRGKGWGKKQVETREDGEGRGVWETGEEDREGRGVGWKWEDGTGEWGGDRMGERSRLGGR